jgi:hypothetical protein
VLAILKDALIITGFVGMMMLLVEYLNVITSGRWQQRIAGNRWGQYFLGAFLGATPGCLGAFAVVAMYSHGMLTLGAVVATMIATAGDESFVMLAMVPKQALILGGILFVFGISVGALTDAISGGRMPRQPACREGLGIHREEDRDFFDRTMITSRWKQCSAVRGTLAVVLLLFGMGIGTGQLGPTDWNWIRVTMIAFAAIAFLIVMTVPDHFLEEHLWRHVARRHAPRIFLWTLGALVVMHLLTDVFSLENSIGEGKWLVLLLACLIGLVPESGPHLIFVTLFAKGMIPFSILLASSVVQDGHGMLPMLAHSRREFFLIKAINFGAGLLLGTAAMALGF